MMKPNGWKRIGIIASAVWILGVGIYTYDSETESASRAIATEHVACDSHLPDWRNDEKPYEAAFRACDKHAEDSFSLAIRNARLSAELFAFVPVPLGWGFTYLILFLLRWVKRGFVTP
jgi:hypothetical protein